MQPANSAFAAVSRLKFRPFEMFVGSETMINGRGGNVKLISLTCVQGLLGAKPRQTVDA